MLQHITLGTKLTLLSRASAKWIKGAVVKMFHNDVWQIKCEIDIPEVGRPLQLSPSGYGRSSILDYRTMIVRESYTPQLQSKKIKDERGVRGRLTR